MPRRRGILGARASRHPPHAGPQPLGWVAGGAKVNEMAIVRAARVLAPAIVVESEILEWQQLRGGRREHSGAGQMIDGDRLDR